MPWVLISLCPLTPLENLVILAAGQPQGKMVTQADKVVRREVGTVCARLSGDPQCKHQWGPLTAYKVPQLNKDGSLKRTDSRERMSCEKCGMVDDVLVGVDHADGLLEL